MRASSVQLVARTTEGRRCVLSCSWLSHGLSAGQALKEGGRGFPCREVVNEAVPVGEPMLPCPRDQSGPAVFHCLNSHHFMIPPQPPPKSMPEIGVKECFFHGDNEGGLVIFPCPHGVFAVGSHIIGVHPVRTVYVITPFGSFVQGFLDRHIFSPLSLRGNGGKVAHIALVSQDDSAGP